MQIAERTVASFNYTLTNAAGEVIDSSEGRAPMAYLHGAGNIVPGLEKEMAGREAGDKFDVVVAEALDRISRDQEDLAGIYKRLRFMEIEIRTVQDGKAEEIHVGVKGLVGALYLKDLAQKTKRGQAGVVRDGRHSGGRS